MRFSPVLAALLCFTTWMSMVYATHGPVYSCCIRWSNTRVPVHRILGYTIQSEGVCPITAIIFQTKSGKKLCSDPNNDWAKRAILKVDKEKEKKALREKGQNEDGSTSDITPAVSTTSKNAPGKRGRNGKRRSGKKSRRGKNRQRKRV